MSEPSKSSTKDNVQKGASLTGKDTGKEKASKNAAPTDSPELIKFRLLGAVVTFVLLALFGPEILDGSGRMHTVSNIEISEPPVLPAPPVMKPTAKLGTGFDSDEQQEISYQNKIDNLDRVNKKLQSQSEEVAKTKSVASDKQAQVKPPAVSDVKKTMATLAEKPGWTLQLATFSQPKNAYALREKLTKAGFNSYNKLLKDSSGKTRYQVFVGPELDKQKLMAVKQKLKTKLKLKDGIIKPYRP
jgi:cell division septation protein DedD